MDKWRDGLMNGLVDGLMDEWMDGWMDGWMDERDGWMDGWIDGYGRKLSSKINQSISCISTEVYELIVSRLTIAYRVF